MTALVAPASTIRPVEPDEFAYVISTWHKAHRRASDLPWCEYKPMQRRTIIRCLARSSVYVLSPPDDPSRILGWICAQHDPGELVVHYVYVRPEERRKGHMTALLRHAWGDRTARVVYSHRPELRAVERAVQARYGATFDQERAG